MQPAESVQPESNSTTRVNNNHHVMPTSTTQPYHHHHHHQQSKILHQHSAGTELHWLRKSNLRKAASMAPKVSTTWIWSILLILFAINLPVANAVSQSLCSSFNTGVDSDAGELHMAIASRIKC